MDFDLTAEQRELRRVVSRVRGRDGRARSRGARPGGYVPARDRRADGRARLLRAHPSGTYGGSDAGTLTAAIVLEELGRADQSIAVTVSVSGGSPAAWSPGWAPTPRKNAGCRRSRRARSSASFALTEPGGGSDAAVGAHHRSPRERALELDGTKAFITNSGTPITGIHVVAAVTDPARGPEGSARSSFPPTRPASPSAPRTGRWDGTLATPTSCRSTDAACPRTTCSVNAVADSPRRSRRWTDGRSDRGHRRRASPRPAWTTASRIRPIGRPSATIGSYQLVQAKLADMRARTRRRACSPTAPRGCGTRAGRTSPRRRWRS